MPPVDTALATTVDTALPVVPKSLLQQTSVFPAQAQPSIKSDNQNQVQLFHMVIRALAADWGSVN